MDRRVFVTDAHKKILAKFDALLVDVCCRNNTLPAIDCVTLCGVLIFLDSRALTNVVSWVYETIGEDPVSI